MIFIFSFRNLMAAFLMVALFSGCARMRVNGELRQFSGTVIENPISQPILNEARQNVVTVLALNEKRKPIVFGSGFYVQSNQIVTCLHVIESAHSLQILLPDGGRHDVAGLFGTDPLMDTAVLWVTNLPPAATPLRFRERPIEVSETAYVLGTPTGLPISASKGSVIKLMEIGTQVLNNAFTLSVPVLPGFSGGPVLDTNGAVIGVIAEIHYSKGGRESVGLPVTEIRTLGEGQPVGFDEWRRKNPAPDLQATLALSRGEGLMFSERTEALKHFDKAVALATNYTRAWVRRGVCLMNLKRNDEAIRSFQYALRIAPDMIVPRVLISFCLSDEKRFGEAIQEAQTIIARRPNSTLAYFSLVAALVGEGDYTGALKAAQAIVRLAPSLPEGHRLMGEMCDLLGVPEAAEKSFHEAVRLRPKKGALWLNLGGMQMETGREIEAVKSLTQALDVLPFAERSRARYLVLAIAMRHNEKEIARKHFDAFMIEEFAHLQRIESSAQSQKKLLALKKTGWNSVQTHRELAALFMFTKRARESVTALEICVRLTPNDPETRTMLALACNVKWRFEHAREEARKAVELKADYAKAYQAWGRAACALGQLDEARPAFVKAVELERHVAANHLGLACVEARAGNAGKVKEHLQEAKRLDKSFPVRFEMAPETIIPDARKVRGAIAQ